MANENLNITLEKQSIKIIMQGQINTRIANFNQVPKTPYYWGFILLAIAFYMNLVFSLIYAGSQGVNLTADFLKQFSDKAVFFFSPILIYFGALIYTTWRQPREISFDMVKELHSREFHEIRFEVLKRAKKANGLDDIDALQGWIPHETYKSIESNTLMSTNNDDQQKGLEEWISEHALSRLAFFMFRIYVADQHGLIERSVARQLFHFFFSHYEMIMLELAYSMKIYIKEYRKTGVMYDERWENFADAIIGFFPIIGLSGKLPENHKFYFFPSVNKLIE